MFNYSRACRIYSDGNWQGNPLFDRRSGHFSRLLLYELPSSVHHHKLLVGGGPAFRLFEPDTDVRLELHGLVHYYTLMRPVRQVQAAQPENV